MSPILGQQIIVEDRPGAGSSIAAEYVAHAARDGYTLFVATLPIITNQIINPNPSFDLTRDLAPVALLASGAVVLVVNPEINVHSVAELIAPSPSRAKCSMPRSWVACRTLQANCLLNALASS
jgi:tripartite-type tricarboxylate transporter receptor subunit TctC